MKVVLVVIGRKHIKIKNTSFTKSSTPNYKKKVAIL